MSIHNLTLDEETIDAILDALFAAKSFALDEESITDFSNAIIEIESQVETERELD